MAYLQLNPATYPTFDATDANTLLTSNGTSIILHPLGNTFVGENCGNITLTGVRNTVVGNDGAGAVGKPGNALTTGSYNTVVSAGGGAALTSGQLNMLFGYQAGPLIADGGNNIAIGPSTGGAVASGNYNCFIGSDSGSNGAADSHNIYINKGFVAGSESNVLRIGAATGSGTQELAAAYVAGIYGVTTSSATTSPVLVSDGNQLGTIASSARYKKDIADMGDSSAAMMKLRPVTFKYKAHTDDVMQFGLIAEEVQEVMPGIVNLDDEGRPDSVRYHDMPAMLLNELQKLAARVAELEAKL